MKTPSNLTEPKYQTEITRIHNKSLAPAGQIYIKITFRYLSGWQRFVRRVKAGTLPKEPEARKAWLDDFYTSALEKTKAKFDHDSKEEEQ